MSLAPACPLPSFLLLLVVVPVAHAAPQPYGTNDAGGFRNVLPPGENGLDTLSQIFSFRGLGTLPPHFADQQPLYENLVYGAPELTDEKVPTYFKDATFGVPSGEVASTIEPRPGVTILRDSAYGVPHIYGDTRADTMFGAGYAGAADRLFLMDVLRHTGRAELASFLGGANAGADASQWGFAPYTEADLQKQLDTLPQQYGPTGLQADEDIQSYVDGINAYITAASHQPSAEAGRVLASEQADGTVEADRRRRDRLADRRHLRSRRRQRAELGPDHAVVPRPLRSQGRPQGMAWLPLEERPRSADDDFPSPSPTRPAAPSPSAAWRCPIQVRCAKRQLPRPRAEPAGEPAVSAPRSSAACAKAATPPTGSWSRPSTLQPAIQLR